MKNRTSRSSWRKNNNASTVLWLILSGISGVLVSIALLLLIALFIKDSHPTDGTVSILGSVVKIIGCFACAWISLPKVNLQPIFSGVISSLIYTVIVTFLFLILSGDGFELRVFVVDILISLISGTLFSLILYKKSLFVKNK